MGRGKSDRGRLTLRLQARDARTGNPVAGVPVRLLAARSADCDPAEAPRSLIATLHTNANGIVAFSSPPLAAAIKLGWSIFANFGGVEDHTFAISPDAWAIPGGVTVITLSDIKKVLAGVEPANVTGWSDGGVGIEDIWSSPSAFPDLGELAFGDDQCSRLIPNDQTLRVFEQNHVVMTERNVLTCSQPTATRPGANSTGSQTITVHRGEVISHEVTWRRLGYTFGDLLYSLALAPGESASVGISSWEQRQRARAARASETGERYTGKASRANSLGETMNAATNHFGVGATAAEGIGAGISAPLGGGVGANLGMARAIGVTANYNRNTFSGEAAREFADHIQQTAEVWRREHQTIVAEQSESEDHSVSIRHVCNKNWGKVLNIFYHEVLENHRVTTRAKGVRDVYFIPHSRPDFDLHRAFCSRPFLEPFLLDPTLARCFEALKYVLFDPRYKDDDAAGENAGADGGDADTPAPAPSPTTNSFRVELRIGNNGLTKGRPAALVIGLHSGSEIEVNIQRDENWKKKSSYSYILTTAPIVPSEIAYIGFKNNSSWAVDIDSYKVSFNDPNGGWKVIGTYAPGKVRSKSKSTQSFNVDWKPPATDAPADNGATDQIPSTAQLDAKEEKADRRRCAEALVAHLNCHAFYYNSLLWLLRDRNERYSWLEGFGCGETPLSDLVEPEPIAVLGHYVAFPVSGSEFRPIDEDEDAALDDRLVVLPTSGVFADAALGQCTARETDLPAVDDPFWKWVENPNTCDGSTITLAAPSANTLLGEGGLDFLGALDKLVAAAPATDIGKDVVSSLAANFGAGLAQHVLGRMTEADIDKLIEALSQTLESGSGSGDGGKDDEDKEDGEDDDG